MGLGRGPRFRDRIGLKALRGALAVLSWGCRERTRTLGQLRSARADGTLERRMLKFTAPDLLIIDDLGLRPLDRDEPIDLYEVIRARYERGSMIVTSNRDLSEWYPLFLDDLMASAAMDRLMHHAHVLELQGDSFRNPPKERAFAKAISS